MKSMSKTLTASLLVISRMSALVIVLAMSAILSRLLDRESYGAFRQILMLYAVLGIIFQAGLPRSIYYFLPRLESGKQLGFILQSLAMLFLQGMILSLGLYFGADILARILKSGHLSELLRAFSPYPALMLPVMAAESTLMTFNRVKSLVFLNVFIKAVMFAAVILPIWLGKSLVFAIQCWVVIAVIQLVITLFLIIQPLPRQKLESAWSVLKEQYIYSMPLALATILGTLALYADKIIVSMFGGDRAFAVYANGAFEIPLVTVIANSVAVTIMPAMVNYAKEGQMEPFLRLWHSVLRKQAMLIFPIFGFFLFFARDSILILFGEKYAQSVNIFRCFLVLTPIRICIFASVLLPLNKNWVYAVGHLIQVFLSVILCVLLYHFFGLVGAAIGAVAAAYCNVLYMGKSFVGIVQVPWKQIWPFRRMLVNLVVAVISGMVAYGSVSILPADSLLEHCLRLGLGTLVFTLIYILLLLCTGLLQVQMLADYYRKTSLAKYRGSA